MSTAHHQARTPAPPAYQGGGRLMVGSLLAGAVGVALLVLGASIDPRQALHSYLAAFAFAVSVAVGALILLAVGHVAQAKWIIVVRRTIEAVTATLPLLAVLFVPLALGLSQLYPWAGDAHGQAHGAGADHHLAALLEHKRPYLNVPFFLSRAGFYFLVWIGLATLLRRWSLASDRRPDPELVPRQRALSAVALPALGLTMTFAAFDWLMSLDPAWFSAAYGLYWFAGGFGGAIALVIVLIARGRAAGTLGQTVSVDHLHALGKLLFAFVVFWAYIAFAQFFLIWIANKPEEVIWYLPRVQGGWAGTSLLLVIGHFGVPFFLLLSRDLKRRPAALAGVAAWLLVMHYLDMYWLVLPSLHEHGLRLHWLDLAGLLAVGGLALAFGVWRQRGHLPVPSRDPAFEASVRYVGP